MVKGFGRRNRRPDLPLPSSVSGSGNLARLGKQELTDHAEVEIMMAGYTLSSWRENRTTDPSLIDQAIMHAEWAADALREIKRRDDAGLAG